MRTIFTTEDLKDIMETIFNGNLKAYKASKGAIEYKNPNSEKILLIDEYDNSQEEKDIAEYLNISFYNWKDRLVSKADEDDYDREKLSVFDSWVQSLNFKTSHQNSHVSRLGKCASNHEIDRGETPSFAHP